jgi:hypothetical protein
MKIIRCHFCGINIINEGYEIKKVWINGNEVVGKPYDSVTLFACRSCYLKMGK